MAAGAAVAIETAATTPAATTPAATGKATAVEAKISQQSETTQQ